MFIIAIHFSPKAISVTSSFHLLSLTEYSQRSLSPQTASTNSFSLAARRTSLPFDPRLPSAKITYFPSPLWRKGWGNNGGTSVVNWPCKGRAASVRCLFAALFDGAQVSECPGWGILGMWIRAFRVRVSIMWYLRIHLLRYTEAQMKNIQLLTVCNCKTRISESHFSWHRWKIITFNSRINSTELQTHISLTPPPSHKKK